jgi:hypothetical protein
MGGSMATEGSEVMSSRLRKINTHTSCRTASALKRNVESCNSSGEIVSMVQTAEP